MPSRANFMAEETKISQSSDTFLDLSAEDEAYEVSVLSF